MGVVFDQAVDTLKKAKKTLRKAKRLSDEARGKSDGKSVAEKIGKAAVTLERGGAELAGNAGMAGGVPGPGGSKAQSDVKEAAEKLEQHSAEAVKNIGSETAAGVTKTIVDVAEGNHIGALKNGVKTVIGVGKEASSGITGSVKDLAGGKVRDSLNPAKTGTQEPER